ncbi:FecR family protein [Parasediminibacterium sp. JCM 36343]|uniref:FecR family protein n=1 Tax=Parasediminibacterium sp. JCM 36343 TaxID=3374279 RepID=UPI00397B7E02
MINSNTITKNILLNHFAGQSTPLQKKVIETWLEDPINVEFYYECLDEWENTNIQFVPNEKAAFAKILQEDALVRDIKKKQPILWEIKRRWAVAAVVFLLAGVSFMLSKDVIFYKTIQTAYGETKLVVLPDSSIVSLNANTSIRFPRFGFGKSKREVWLNGEADFSVVHTKSNQQFVVTTDNKLKVQVLGTQFTVYARNNNANVVLRKGKVCLNYTEKNIAKGLVMQPGDLFTSNTASGQSKLAKIDSPEKLSAWKNHDFIFDGSKLLTIGDLLKDDFGIAMKFEDAELATKTISGSVHAETADELIDAIAQLLDINYKIKDNTVYFFE